jgi:hypothetical protein
MRPIRVFFAATLLLAFASTLPAQDAVASSPISVVPHVVKYSGTLPNAPAAASVVQVRFAMYGAQTGGDALWTETQQVALDPQSKYSVLLGATAPAGLPQNLFANGASRWLGVTLAGQEESPRTLLAASPYSLKASDAETLGGHPASDFTLKNATPDSGVDITDVVAGTGITVTGNGTATVTVGINSTYLDGLAANFAALNAANTFTASQTIDGNLAVSGTFKTAGGANKLAPGGAVDITYANGIYTIGLDATQGEAFGNGLWAQLGAANTFKAMQTLAPLGTATASAGFNSNALQFSESAFNSAASAAEAVNFVWQAEPYNNDTSQPTGYLDLLTSIGTAAPAETGLRIGAAGGITFATGQTFPGVPTLAGINTFAGINAFSNPITFAGGQIFPGVPTLAGSNTFAGINTFSNPITFAVRQIFLGAATLSGSNAFTGANTFSKAITFASGQTFPGTGTGNGTITGITTTSPLSGSGTTGSVALSLNTSVLETTLNGIYPTLSGANNFSGSNTFSAANTFAATQDFTSNGSATASGGKDSFALEFTASSYNSSTAAAEPINFLWKAEHLGNNTATPSGTLNLLYVAGTGGASETGLNIASTGLINFASGQTFPGTGTGDGTITGITTTSPLAGSGTSGSVALSLNTSALETTLNGVYAELGANNTFTSAQTISGGAATELSVTTGNSGGTAVLGTGGSKGVSGSGTSYGVYGNSASGTGVYGTSASTTGAPGVQGVSTTTSNFGVGVIGNASGPGAYGVYGNSASGTGVYGTASSDTGIGVYGGNTATDISANGDGVRGEVAWPNAFAMHAISVGPSVAGAPFDGYGEALWADTNQAFSTGSGGALYASADDNYAGTFVNNSNAEATLAVINGGTGGLGDTVPLMTAAGKNGACGINSGGDVTCSGHLQTSVALAGNTRQVAVYSVQSSENWFEDFGTAKLDNGHVTVTIDPEFAQIVNTGVPYHVFLTPSGNCKGLYVASRSASGFEVRELGDGGSSVEFDYRIVAKRAGHETERLADTTVEMHRMTARRDEMDQLRAKGVTRRPRPEPVQADAVLPTTLASGPPHFAAPAPRILAPHPVKAGDLLRGHSKADSAK